MGSRTIFETDIVYEVCEELEKKGVQVFAKDMREIWETAFEVIRNTLNEGNKVQINNFATIELYRGKPSRVRHPVSGELIPSGVKNKRVRFSPIGKFKKELKISNKKEKNEYGKN